MPLKPAVRLDWEDWKQVFPEMEVCGGGIGMCDSEVPSSGVNPALVLDGDAEDVVVVEGEDEECSHDGEVEVRGEKTA